MSADTLGDRMKGYEAVAQSHLMRRTPVILRLDGRAFHTFTKCLKDIDPTLKDTPFSIVMHKCMAATTKALIDNIQNAVIGYSQSDEITILLRDWDRHETQQWFDGNIQKIVSISAAIASVQFTKSFSIETALALSDCMDDEALIDDVERMERIEKLEMRDRLIQFDSRVFNIPDSEVINNFIWRQQDASRNSVQMLARHYFSHKQLHKKNNSEIQEMLFAQHGINWNDIPTWMRRGFCVTRDGVDRNIPIFTQDRDYIGKHLVVEDVA